MLVEQRFNKGALILDRCTFSAPQRPEVARQLLEIQSLGDARLDVFVRNSDLRDSIGSAIDASVAENGTLALSVVDTTMQHFGDRIISVSARQTSHLGVVLHGSQFAAPAVRERAWIEVTGADTAAVCADMATNRFTAPEGTAIRLAATTHSVLRIVGGGPDARAALVAANGGVPVAIDGSVTSVTGGCP
jgi:hypothetical protein